MLETCTPSWSEKVLVGGWALPLWKMMEFVSWDHYSQNMESYQIPWLQSPPTRVQNATSMYPEVNQWYMQGGFTVFHPIFLGC